MARKPHTRTTTQRGYGHAHRQLRKQYAAVVASGRAVCWRCRKHIHPAEPWHLGHDDNDRRYYRGPEHVQCSVTHRQERPPAKALDFFK